MFARRARIIYCTTVNITTVQIGDAKFNALPASLSLATGSDQAGMPQLSIVRPAEFGCSLVQKTGQNLRDAATGLSLP